MCLTPGRSKGKRRLQQDEGEELVWLKKRRLAPARAPEGCLKRSAGNAFDQPSLKRRASSAFDQPREQPRNSHKRQKTAFPAFPEVDEFLQEQQKRDAVSERQLVVYQPPALDAARFRQATTKRCMARGLSQQALSLYWSSRLPHQHQHQHQQQRTLQRLPHQPGGAMAMDVESTKPGNTPLLLLTM